MNASDPSAAQAVVDQLRRLAEQNHGKVPSVAVRAVAARLGCSERTVWGWLRNGVPAPRSRRSLNRSALIALAVAQGSMKAAWGQLRESQEYTLSYRQFVRDVHALDPIIRDGLRHGVAEGLQRGLYVKSVTGARLDRVVFDHTEADIWLRRERAGKVETFRPWVSLLIDSSSRMIMSCVVTEGDGMRGDPNTETLVMLMASAIRGSTAADGTFVGGVPLLVQFDNAKAHVANAMVNGYIELGIATYAIEPGSPWQDGLVERLMYTMNQEFLASLVGYTAALADRYSKPPWKPEECLSIAEFQVRLAGWVDRYNYERVHSSLKSTPFEAWRADPTPIRRVDDAAIRHGFLAEHQRRAVSKNGVRFRNVDYVHSELRRLVGKKVRVRFLPNDLTFIDVYDGNAFVCTAVPHARLTKDERTGIIRDRQKDVRAVDRIIKTSRARAVEREVSGNPLLAPERDPNLPARLQDDSDDEFLAFLDSISNRETDNP